MYRLNERVNDDQIYRLFEDSVAISGSPSLLQSRPWDSEVWTRSTGRVHDLEQSPGLERLNHEWTARSFAEDRSGSVWIGFDGQLARYSDGKFVLFTADDGVPPGAIKEIYLDHAGRLWLASGQSGLTRLDIAADAKPRFTNYTTANGLSSNNLVVITEDRQGYIYTGLRQWPRPP